VAYNIQCGTVSGGYVFSGANVSYVTPSVQLMANSTDRQLGQPLTLTWITSATSCTPSGGAPNDGWTGTGFSTQPFDPLQQFSPNVTTVGTYTYGLSCSGGPSTVQQSIMVTVENNPGYVRLIGATPASVTYSDSPADYITLSWISNLSSCDVSDTNSAPVGVTSDGNPQDIAR
jgi:hypothetical protein